MTDSSDQKPSKAQACDKYVPPPMDPYARYQTPYDRRPDEKNPFIEFRRFADKQLSSWFDGWDTTTFPNLSQMFGLSDEMKKMRDHSEQGQREMQNHIEDVIERRHKMIEAMLEEQRQQTIEQNKQQFRKRAEETADYESPQQHLPEGWLSATTRDGKEYFIEQATGKATSEFPAEALFQRHLADRAARWKRGFEKCPELKDLKEDVYEDFDFGPILDEQAEQNTRWQRGMKKCPELKKYNDDTELAMYEQLDEQEHEHGNEAMKQYQTQLRSREQQNKASNIAKQDTDYYKSDEHWNEVWEQGLQKCPELQTNHESRHAVEDALTNSSEEPSQQTRRKWRPSPWWWLSTMGHDGKQL